MTEPGGRRARGGRGTGQPPPQSQPPPPGALRSLNSREVAFHLLNAMQLEDEEASGTAAAGPGDTPAAARGAAAGPDAAPAAQRGSVRAFPIELNELGSAALSSGYHPHLERLDEGPTPSASVDDAQHGDRGPASDDGLLSPFGAPGVPGPTFDSSDANASPFGAAGAVGAPFGGPSAAAAAADTIASPFGAPDAAPAGLGQSSDDFPLLPPTAAGPAAATAAGGGGGPRTAASTRQPADAAPPAPRPSLKPPLPQQQQQQQQQPPKGPRGPPPPPPARRRGRRLIPLRRVMRDAYEYHGLNELGLFFLFAMLTNVVLYFHWTDTTANFKNTVQYAFKSYGNPDWQGQSFAGATTMSDGVEYLAGWLQFWIQRAQDVDWPPSPFGFPGQTVRVGEYAEIVYARLMVNLDNNCGRGSLSCWRDDPEVNGTLLANGWRNVGEMDHQMATQASSLKARITGKGRSNWLAFPIIAPLIDGAAATRLEYLQRLYAGVTPATSINHDDDLAREALASVCPNGTGLAVFPATSEVTCGGPKKLPPGAVLAAASSDALNGLKPFIARYAYALTLEVLAIDVMSRPRAPDMALFSMQVQRSDVPSDWPHGVLWHITTTLPVRFSFYSMMPWDAVRAATEGALLVAVALVAYSQLWQQRVVKWQHGGTRSFWKQFWNVFELISTGVLCLWVLFYIALATVLLHTSPRWHPKLWDAVGPPAPAPDPAAVQLREVGRFAYYYSLWLFGGILVDSLVCLRILRYMRIHPGLKAFYTVFIIAAREFLDFAVFLLYIMLLLGSAIFAFFQLTGGNDQFVRFSDGLSVMTRLTFGFLSYEDFQNQALGLGSAVSAVTLFFWCGVLLLVVFSQNIILAIVAEAYEQAKFDLGRADTSFVVLIFLRFAFLLVLLSSRARMVVNALRKAVAACCWGGGNGPPESSRATSYTAPDAAPPAGKCDGGDSGTDVGAGGKDAGGGARGVGGSDVEAPSSPKGRVGSRRGLQRAITHLRSMRLDRHDERVYREMMAISEHSLRSRWGSWARRYWAPWAVARTPGVRSLMALYQDFASYKIKTQPAWIGAQEAARATLARTPSEAAMLPTPSGDQDGGSGGEEGLRGGGGAALPDLSQGEGVVTEDELTRLLLVAVEMGRSPPVWPSPFAGVRHGSIDTLVHAIASVYGFDAEEEPAQDGSCLTSAPSVAPMGGGGGGGGAPSPLKASQDLRLGSMAEHRGGGGGGFFSRLAGLRRGGPDGANTGGAGLAPEGTLAGVAGGRGAPPPQAMRAMMREQRRLEEQIARANRSTEQLMEMMARQLANQRRTLSDQGRQLSTVAVSVDRIAGAFTAGGPGGSGGGTPNAPGPAAAGPAGSGGGSSLFGQRVGAWKRSSFAARAFSSAISQDGRGSLDAAAGPASPAATAAVAAAAAASADAGTAPSSAAGPTEAPPSTVGGLTPVGSGISAGASSGGGGSDSVAALQQRIEEQQKTLDVILGLLQETKSRGSVAA